MNPRRRVRRTERGSAIVEAPFAIAVIIALGLGAFWVGNLVLRYHQLEEAVHAGARYGARAYFDPAGGASRRRTAAEITNYVSKAAEPVAGVQVEIRCGNDLNTLAAEPICTQPETQPAGTFIQVRATSIVAEDDPILGFGRAVNAMFNTIRVGSPFPDHVTVTDASVAIVE